tara:strand:+ start:217 stop:456 length:240 start_codon:yes stop_codon:yes gene_type:complete
MCPLEENYASLLIVYYDKKFAFLWLYGATSRRKLKKFHNNPNKGYSNCGCKQAGLPEYRVRKLSHSFHYTSHLPWERRV